MCGICFCIFLLIILFSILRTIAYLNFELVLVLFMYLIIYIIVSIKYNKDYIIRNAKKILVGFYKVEENAKTKTVELYFKNNGTCDILYNNVQNNKWWEDNYIQRKNIPYSIYKNKVYLEFDEYDERVFCINKNYLTETRNNELVKYHKITYNESKLYKTNRNKRRTNSIKREEKIKTTTKKITNQPPTSKKKKEVTSTKEPSTKIKKEQTTTKKTETKKKTSTTKTKVNSNKTTKIKHQPPTINKITKDLKVKNTKDNLSKTYVIDYSNENEFRKKERGIKKYNMLTYKKLMFEYYPSLREGNFSGVVVSKNDQEQIFKYELKLPTDSTFSKVYEDIVLHYTVYENQKIVMLNDITPGDILIEGNQKGLTTYKGVPISKSHAEKDMFKINLLNMLGK